MNDTDLEQEDLSQGDDADDLPLVDENAFGIWVSWFDAEDVEYAQSADKFPPRIMVFRSAVIDYLETNPLGSGATAIDCGTAIYLEIAAGDQSADILAWTREFRAFLARGDWSTFVAVTHGGRWVPVAEEARMPSRVGDVSVIASFGPSEPFRKAMAAEAMAHDDEETGDRGWGSGMFVDIEAMEALSRKLKNEPTALCCAGGCFFRIGA